MKHFSEVALPYKIKMHKKKKSTTLFDLRYSLQVNVKIDAIWHC